MGLGCVWHCITDPLLPWHSRGAHLYTRQRGTAAGSSLPLHPGVMLGCLGSGPAGTLFICACWSTMLCNHPARCLEIQVNKMSSACLQKCSEVSKSPPFLGRFIVSRWPWTFLSAPQGTVLPLFWQTHVLGVVRWPLGLEHWAAKSIYLRVDAYQLGRSGAQHAFPCVPELDAKVAEPLKLSSVY